jgi:hypothetical protein
MFILTYLSCREVSKSVCAALGSGYPGTLAIVNHAVHDEGPPYGLFACLGVPVRVRLVYQYALYSSNLVAGQGPDLLHGRFGISRRIVHDRSQNINLVEGNAIYEQSIYSI